MAKVSCEETELASFRSASELKKGKGFGAASIWKPLVRWRRAPLAGLF